MKLSSHLLTAAALVFLSGCALHGPLDELNRSQPVGSPFNTYLANEYRLLATRLWGSDSEHFAKKGLAAVDGMIVAPEMVEDWNIKHADVGEIAEARGALLTVLDNGGREADPAKAAIAQSHFDCWLMEEEKAKDENASCRDVFYANLKGVQDAVAAAQQAPAPAAVASGNNGAGEQFPAPVTEEKGDAVPLQQAAYLVFFDWNKHNINPSGKKVLDTVAHELKERKDVKKIVVTGHTDTSGSEKYNKKLSIQRADAVKSALTARGLPAKDISTDGKGESDLLVKTPDNTREPQNRRAAITLE